MPATFPIHELTKGETRSLLEADTANELIRSVNKVLTVQVRIVTSGGSRLEIADENAVLIVSTKDILLGTISGSKGSNAALTSLISALKNTFALNDTTT
jgi:hypothetical protein